MTTYISSEAWMDKQKKLENMSLIIENHKNIMLYTDNLDKKFQLSIRLGNQKSRVAHKVLWTD